MHLLRGLLILANATVLNSSSNGKMSKQQLQAALAILASQLNGVEDDEVPSKPLTQPVSAPTTPINSDQFDLLMKKLAEQEKLIQTLQAKPAPTAEEIARAAEQKAKDEADRIGEETKRLAEEAAEQARLELERLAELERQELERVAELARLEEERLVEEARQEAERKRQVAQRVYEEMMQKLDEQKKQLEADALSRMNELIGEEAAQQLKESLVSDKLPVIPLQEVTNLIVEVTEVQEPKETPEERKRRHKEAKEKLKQKAAAEAIAAFTSALGLPQEQDHFITQITSSIVTPGNFTTIPDLVRDQVRQSFETALIAKTQLSTETAAKLSSDATALLAAAMKNPRSALQTDAANSLASDALDIGLDSVSKALLSNRAEAKEPVEAGSLSISRVYEGLQGVTESKGFREDLVESAMNLAMGDRMGALDALKDAVKEAGHSIVDVENRSHNQTQLAEVVVPEFMPDAAGKLVRVTSMEKEAIIAKAGLDAELEEESHKQPGCAARTCLSLATLGGPVGINKLRGKKQKVAEGILGGLDSANQYFKLQDIRISLLKVSAGLADADLKIKGVSRTQIEPDDIKQSIATNVTADLSTIIQYLEESVLTEGAYSRAISKNISVEKLKQVRDLITAFAEEETLRLALWPAIFKKSQMVINTSGTNIETIMGGSPAGQVLWCCGY